MAESGRFKVWLNRALAKETPEEWVDKQMTDDKLRIEVRGDRGWIDDSVL